MAPNFFRIKCVSVLFSNIATRLKNKIDPKHLFNSYDRCQLSKTHCLQKRFLNRNIKHYMLFSCLSISLSIRHCIIVKHNSLFYASSDRARVFGKSLNRASSAAALDQDITCSRIITLIWNKNIKLVKSLIDLR